MTLDEVAKGLEEMNAELQVMTTAVQSLLAVVEEVKKAAQAKEAPTPAPEEKPVPKETPITLEQVRKVLAAKSMEGYREEVKDLITLLGVNRLSDVPADKYKELLEKAEALSHGSN